MTAPRRATGAGLTLGCRRPVRCRRPPPDKLAAAEYSPSEPGSPRSLGLSSAANPPSPPGVASSPTSPASECSSSWREPALLPGLRLLGSRFAEYRSERAAIVIGLAATTFGAAGSWSPGCAGFRCSRFGPAVPSYGRHRVHRAASLPASPRRPPSRPMRPESATVGDRRPHATSTGVGRLWDGAGTVVEQWWNSGGNAPMLPVRD